MVPKYRTGKSLALRRAAGRLELVNASMVVVRLYIGGSDKSRGDLTDLEFSTLFGRMHSEITSIWLITGCGSSGGTEHRIQEIAVAMDVPALKSTLGKQS